MMGPFFDQQQLAVLNSPRLELPRPSRRLESDTLARFLRGEFAHLYELLDKLAEFDHGVGPEVARRSAEVRVLGDKIVLAAEKLAHGQRSEALEELDLGLREVQRALHLASQRHSLKVAPVGCWYRLANRSNVSTRSGIFHVPFDKVQRPGRFSTPNVPTLYLGNSVFLCWLECGGEATESPPESCAVARFEIRSHLDFLDLPCNFRAYIEPLRYDSRLPSELQDPRRLTNSPYLDDINREVAEFLAIWPLLAAVSLPRNPSVHDPVEYSLPQLLMEWVRSSENFLGVRYFTTKSDDPRTSQDWSINAALPSRSQKTSGHCEFLAQSAPCTEPQEFRQVLNLNPSDYLTAESTEMRGRRMGRVMLARDGELEDYAFTIFGRMEYWLDKPELKIASVLVEDST